MPPIARTTLAPLALFALLGATAVVLLLFLVDERAALDDCTARIATLGEKLTQVKNESSQDVLNFPSRVDNQLMYLQGIVESSDRAPTVASFERFGRTCRMKLSTSSSASSLQETSTKSTSLARRARSETPTFPWAA